MKMKMKKIPSNVQSLLCASKQINNYHKAVEELVYNALDAGATSIAVRINIPESAVQVIDNGAGVCSKDFNFIGNKYMTSKFVDLSTLKSASNAYGFCGQFLANLINVSKSVKIVSRHKKSEETWMKCYENGKEKQIKKCATRPSKGTTVEVEGFLFNLSIQKKSRDILSELQSIKTFLEHLSIAHCNISLSLRDESKNEIIFKIHKNRDIYQTLSTLYNIEKKDFQELQVEKNEYKITAFLGKSNNEYGKHLIFLNRKFISRPSTLHKIVSTNLKKHINLKGIKKAKNQNHNKDEEDYLFQKKIPDYFIFLKCPYMDYNLSTSSKQAVLEFKDWNQVQKLLEKLVGFFTGNINLKDVNKGDKNKAIHKTNNSEIREQVKKIMEKILGTQSKNPGISHITVQNGIKGKQIKRKRKKLPKIMTARMINFNDSNNGNNKITSKDISDDQYMVKKNNPNLKRFNVEKESNVNKETVSKIYSKPKFLSLYLGNNLARIYNSKFKKISIANKTQLQKNQLIKENSKTKPPTVYKDKRLGKFEMKTDSFKKRYNELHQRTAEILKQGNKENFLKTPKHNLTKYNYENAYNNVKSQVLPSNYDLLRTILTSHLDEAYNAIPLMDKQPKTAICKAQSHIIDIESENNLTDLRVTFQSHNYNIDQNFYAEKMANTNRVFDLQRENSDDHNSNKLSKAFITKESRDNFIIPKVSCTNNITNKFKSKKIKTVLTKQFKSHVKRLFNQTSKLLSMKNKILGNSEASSLYTIEVSESHKYNITTDRKSVRNSPDSPINRIIKDNSKDLRSQSVNFNCNVGNSERLSLNVKKNTVPYMDDNGYTINDSNWNTYGSYTITNEIINRNQVPSELNEGSKKIVYISETQEHSQSEQINYPVYVCETVINSQEILDREFEFSFNNKQNNLCNKVIDNNDSQTKHNNSQNDNVNVIENEHDQRVTDDQHQVEKLHADNIFQEVSHHFSLPNINIEISNNNKLTEPKKQNLILNSKLNSPDENQKSLSNVVAINLNDDFYLKNRLFYLPKGMSPIFENCHTKNACDYDLAKDYYEDEMYDTFADNVRNKADIFKPKIQEANELTTKAIDKVNAKLNKDNSSLTFDTESLKNVKVHGQIDEKFIATIMKEGCNKEEIADFLVLFDQHAVHERIRLENNLSDYFNENQWKPVNIDKIRMKISKEEVLYLHNFKDKFEQLGLRWTFLDTNEVSFSAIAEAILGKNPRQVDVVLKAVKNLITEEINIIKMQGGCVSLYPKSIMDLVFSEACRYAIKFGDKLSKTECGELLKMLSNCNTPFQCAHGRPVMAVIMNIKMNKVDYKVNIRKIIKWKEN